MSSEPSARPPEVVRYFAYGTLQSGFSNHEAHADLLGRCLGRFRTVEPHPLVVPHRAACPNPGCRHVHRIGALLPDPGRGRRVEGEVYELDAPALARLDALESYLPEDEASSTYLRRRVSVEPLGEDAAAEGAAPFECEVYFIADAEPYRVLLRQREADAVARYTPDLAEGELKACCRRRPDHAGPHDVSRPFRDDSGAG